MFTILIVDSATSFTDFMLEFLPLKGHVLLRAESAAEALEKARHFRPDMILLDSELKGESSLILMSDLLIEQPRALLIVMARQPDVRAVVEAMRLGAADYVQRPIDMGRIKRAIEDQMAEGG